MLKRASSERTGAIVTAAVQVTSVRAVVRVTPVAHDARKVVLARTGVVKNRGLPVSESVVRALHYCTAGTNGFFW